MNQLESRKKLLIAESELNREQLVNDINELSVGVRRLADRAKFFGSIALSAAVVVAGLKSLRGGGHDPHVTDANAKPSWLQRTLKGASLVSTLWMAFRSQSAAAKSNKHESNGQIVK